MVSSFFLLFIHLFLFITVFSLRMYLTSEPSGPTHHHHADADHTTTHTHTPSRTYELQPTNTNNTKEPELTGAY